MRWRLPAGRSARKRAPFAYKSLFSLRGNTATTLLQRAIYAAKSTGGDLRSMLLLSLVQKVQVINWPSPKPSPSATTDPINFQALHVAWLTFDITFWAVVIAVIAASLGGWALSVAIRDAKRNQQQLDLAKRQFDIVANQLLEQTKQPDLEMNFQQAGSVGPGYTATFDPNLFKKIPINISLPIVIRNVGERDANHVRVQVLIAAVRCKMINGSDTVEVITGRPYRSALVEYGGRLRKHGGAWRALPEPTVEVYISDEPINVLLKAYDEFGNTYPEPVPGQLTEHLALQLLLRPESGPQKA